MPVTPLLNAALSSRSDDARMAQAISELQQKGDWTALATLAQERLQRDPGDANAWILLGYSLQEQGKVPEALVALTRATAANPEDIDAWNLLADVERRAGRPGVSLRTLERAAAVDPTSAVTRYLMGEAHREIGDMGRAEAAYREALQLAPRFVPAWFGLGLVALHGARQTDIEAVARQLQELDPGAAQAFARLRAGGRR